MSIQKALHQFSLVELLSERDSIIDYESRIKNVSEFAERANERQAETTISALKALVKSVYGNEIQPIKSRFQLTDINNEIEKRNSDEKELNEAYRVKEEIQKIRNKKGNKELTAFMKVVIFIIPEIVFSGRNNNGPTQGAWEDEDTFLQQAGYQKIAKQRLRLATAGMAFRIVLFALLFIWFKYMRS